MDGHSIYQDFADTLTQGSTYICTQSTLLGWRISNGYSDTGVYMYIHRLPWDDPGMGTVHQNFMDTLTQEVHM